MFDYKTQLIEELDNLREKLAELTDMAVHPGFEALPKREQDLVRAQLQAMNLYAEALEARVDLT